MKLKGTNAVLRNLNKELEKVGWRTEAGLLEAGLFVKRESVKKTPVDTGNLRNSAYVQKVNLRVDHAVEIGYTAAYAGHVHEIDRNCRVGQYKFLETALKENVRQIMRIIEKRVKL